MFDEVDLLDWKRLNPAQVTLSLEQVRQAARLSQPSTQRWQTYLSKLGMMGFQQWLSDRAPDLAIQPQPGSLGTVHRLQVGGFQICLIPIVSGIEETVSVPISIFDAPERAAHFYVLAEVIEEAETIAISGFLSYEQYRQSRNRLQAQSDSTVDLPLNWFNTNANALLLNLRCLEPSAIRLPAAQRETINVGLWLRNQMDAIAQELGWVLMPNLSAVRSLREDFELIRSTLEQQGVQIPAEARGAYRSLRSTEGSFRLYAVTWEVLEASEWSLLVTVGAEPNEVMPRNLKLLVRDETQLLFEQALENQERSVLYAQVLGDYQEKFWVTVMANEDDAYEIPPFGFEQY
jgi:hypothetical protein